MNDTTKRSILRWIHLVFIIPILGYIYGEASEVQQYAAAVRFIFVPIIVLFGILDVFGRSLRRSWRCGMAWCISPVWSWRGYPESGGAIHRVEDLVADPCATFSRAATVKLAVQKV
jgi:hypothetical protein